MRVGLAGVCLVGLLAVGCNESRTAPSSLTLSPSGVVTVQGPKTFQATAINTGGPVTWTLTGTGNVGTLSAATGEWVVYRPPATPAVGATATLTANSGSFSATAQLQLSPPALTAAQIPGLTDAVEVRYDQWEIPHITCAKAVDCFAVQGYLHARDRLFQIDLLRRAATGRMAELVGVLGLSQDVQLRTLFTTRAGERLGDALARTMAAQRPDTNAKAVAYVAGINAYLAHLRATGAPLPGEYAQLPYHVTAAATDIPDWTVGDVLSLMRLMQYQLSSTLDEEVAYGRFAAEFGGMDPKLSVWIRTQQPSSEQTFTLQPGNSPAPLPKLAGASPAATAAAPNLSGWGGPLASLANGMAGFRDLLDAVNGSTGSNDWVVDAGHSATGKAMVANDPHLSLQYPPNFYLATLTSTDPTEHLDVTGGGFAGTPGAQVGRGQHVGWGVTVVGYDVTDIYQEQFLPAASCPGGFPYCVLFNRAPVNLIPVPLTFMVRTSAGLVDAKDLGLPASQTPPAAALIVPHHGPIIQAPDAAGKAFSVRWTGHEDATQDLSAFLDLDTAGSVAEAMAAVNDWATGAQNFVLADDAGNIGYNPHALVPKRSWVGTVASGQPLLPWFPLPGDGSAEWGAGTPGDCAAAGLDGTGAIKAPPSTCWIDKTLLPQATGSATGFLITANADPVGTSTNTIGPFGVPLDVNGNYLSFGWDDSTAFRHARITERMKQALSAGGGTVSQADMEAIQADHVSRMGAAFYRYMADPARGIASFGVPGAMLTDWKNGGFDCPSGLLGIDPVTSPVDPDPTVYKNSAGCYLFHVFARELLTVVFTDDLAQAGLSVGPIQAVKGMLHMLENPPGSATPADQSFCNDVDAAGGSTPVTCETQVRTALQTAFGLLYAQHGNPTAGGWIWGRVHTFQPVSQFPLVTLGYEPGPFARPGGAFTVDVASPSLSGAGTSFAFSSSANVRHVSVMDPAAPVVRMQLPGPEVSRPYGVTVGPDLLADWARNTYFDYAHGDQILDTTVATQRFTP